MARTYRALLEGDRLKWLGESPQETDKPLNVQVTVLERVSDVERAVRGQAMADVLAKIAARKRLAAISDPCGWQRELRRDRELPDRNR